MQTRRQSLFCSSTIIKDNRMRQRMIIKKKKLLPEVLIQSKTIIREMIRKRYPCISTSLHKSFHPMYFLVFFMLSEIWLNFSCPNNSLAREFLRDFRKETFTDPCTTNILFNFFIYEKAQYATVETMRSK